MRFIVRQIFDLKKSHLSLYPIKDQRQKTDKAIKQNDWALFTKKLLDSEA